MTIKFYRLWHACSHLERVSTTQKAYRFTAIGLLIWAVTCVLPLFLILFFPDTLGGGKTFFIILTFLGGSLFMLLLFGSMLLASLYDSYQYRARFYLENAHLSCLNKDEFIGLDAVNASLLYEKKRLEAEQTIIAWTPVPLPMERKWALIQAGIPVGAALDDAIQKMTMEDLHVTAVLHGRTIMTPTRKTSFHTSLYQFLPSP